MHHRVMNAENVKVLTDHLSHGLEFEKSHKMSSNNFYKKFNEGKLRGRQEYIKWFSAYKIRVTG